jgi:catechol 2,3-dioxygenase-like lactoylglutathione lyase family enzyme
MLRTFVVAGSGSSAGFAARPRSPCRWEDGGVRVEGIDHLVLTVRDIDRTVAFYAALGMERIDFGGGRVALACGDQKINLHLAGHELSPAAARPTPGSGDLCLRLAGPLDDALARLAEHGIAVELGPVPRTGARGPLRSVYVRDPDGNLVELAKPA